MPYKTLTEKIHEQLTKRGPMTRRELGQYANTYNAILIPALEELLSEKQIAVVPDSTPVRYTTLTPTFTAKPILPPLVPPHIIPESVFNLQYGNQYANHPAAKTALVVYLFRYYPHTQTKIETELLEEVMATLGLELLEHRNKHILVRGHVDLSPNKTFHRLRTKLGSLWRPKMSVITVGNPFDKDLLNTSIMGHYTAYKYVWGTWAGKPFLVDAIPDTLEMLIRRNCDNACFRLLDLKITPHHVQMSVVTDTTKSAKDGWEKARRNTATQLREMYPHLKKQPGLWTDEVWVQTIEY